MTKIEDLDDGAGFLAWACNIPPKGEDTGHRCRVCGEKVWRHDLCLKHARKEKENEE